MASHKVNMVAETVELMNQLGQCSLASHTLRKEEGSGHTATIKWCHGRNLLRMTNELALFHETTVIATP